MTLLQALPPRGGDAAVTGVLAGVIVVLGQVALRLIDRAGGREHPASEALRATLQRVDASITASTTAIALIASELRDARSALTDSQRRLEALQAATRDVLSIARELLKRSAA